MKTNLVDVVDERGERLVAALRDRVEAVGGVLLAESVLDDAAAVCLAVQFVERSRQLVVARRVAKKVAGELTGHEAAVRLVVRERFVDPFASGR